MRNLLENKLTDLVGGNSLGYFQIKCSRFAWNERVCDEAQIKKFNRCDSYVFKARYYTFQSTRGKKPITCSVSLVLDSI